MAALEIQIENQWKNALYGTNMNANCEFAMTEKRDIDQEEFDKTHYFIVMTVLEITRDWNEDNTKNIFFSICKALLCIGVMSACSGLKEEDDIDEAHNEYDKRLVLLKRKIDFCFTCIQEEMAKVESEKSPIIDHLKRLTGNWRASTMSDKNSEASTSDGEI